MKEVGERIDVDELFREIGRYLEVVEEFRATGCDVGGLLNRDGGGDGRAREVGGPPGRRPTLPHRADFGEPPVSAA